VLVPDIKPLSPELVATVSLVLESLTQAVPLVAKWFPKFASD
jgi:hypothetical protein